MFTGESGARTDRAARRRARHLCPLLISCGPWIRRLLDARPERRRWRRRCWPATATRCRRSCLYGSCYRRGDDGRDRRPLPARRRLPSRPRCRPGRAGQPPAAARTSISSRRRSAIGCSAPSTRSCRSRRSSGAPAGGRSTRTSGALRPADRAALRAHGRGRGARARGAGRGGRDVRRARGADAAGRVRRADAVATRSAAELPGRAARRASRERARPLRRRARVLCAAHARPR